MVLKEQTESSDAGVSGGKKPDFKADGVAVWENIDKNGNKYLSIKIVGHEKILAFQN